jgi:hypothetical protein
MVGGRLDLQFELAMVGGRLDLQLFIRALLGLMYINI